MSSLDGFIAGPNGEPDWIIMDPDIDFAAIFAEFDTLLISSSSGSRISLDRRLTLLRDFSS